MLNVVEPEHCSGTDIAKIKMSKMDLNVELEMVGTSLGMCWTPEVQGSQA